MSEETFDYDLSGMNNEPGGSDDAMPGVAPIATAGISGKTFVSGLFWQPLSRPRAYKQEAAEIGRREGMDVVAVRMGSIYQAGFAPKGQGATKGMYSLAAALAELLGNSWIGAFDLGDGRYAFVAVNDGAIVPGCDMIGSREEVESRLRYFYGAVSEWGKIFAPAEFDFGGETANINELLAPGALSKRRWAQHQLHPLSFGMGREEIIRYAVIAGVFLLVVIAYSQYSAMRERQAREAAIRAEIARKAEEDRARALVDAENADKNRPWGALPTVDAFLRACGSAVDQLPISIGGWLFSEATCTGADIAAKYRRALGGTSAGFLADLQRTAYRDATRTFTPDQDEVLLRAVVKADVQGGEKLMEESLVLASVSSELQRYGLVVAFTPAAAEVAPAGLPGQAPDGAATEPPKPLWKRFEYKFDTEIDPAALLSSTVWPGLRIKTLWVSLENSTSKLRWNINGELYAK